MKRTLMLLLALFLSALGEFCLFGAIASMEAKVENNGYLPFLIGYSIFCLSFFTCSALVGIGAFGLNRSNLAHGLMGMILGAALAFASTFVIFMMGPRWDLLGASAGVIYGILLAPIGAVICGLSGVWIIKQKRPAGFVTNE